MFLYQDINNVTSRFPQHTNNETRIVTLKLIGKLIAENNTKRSKQTWSSCSNSSRRIRHHPDKTILPGPFLWKIKHQAEDKNQRSIKKYTIYYLKKNRNNPNEQQQRHPNAILSHTFWGYPHSSVLYFPLPRFKKGSTTQGARRQQGWWGLRDQVQMARHEMCASQSLKIKILCAKQVDENAL